MIPYPLDEELCPPLWGDEADEHSEPPWFLWVLILLAGAVIAAFAWHNLFCERL